jgi:hypothetical protein
MVLMLGSLENYHQLRQLVIDFKDTYPSEPQSDSRDVLLERAITFGTSSQELD